MNETIIQFDPTIAQLNNIVEQTKNITATDLKDKEQLAIVKRNRIDLGKARITIEKKGKELRADALKFQKDVIAKEKELIGIIEPEENRLKEIEIQAEHLAVMEIREKSLPERRGRLLNIDTSNTWAEDNLILNMSDVEFEVFFNQCVFTHNEIVRLATEKELAERNKVEQDKLNAERLQLEAERAKIDAEKNKLAELARIEDAKKQAVLNEQERIKKEEDEKILKEKDATRKLEKQKAYTDFLKLHGWTEETKSDYKVEEGVNGWVLFKKLGTFNK